MLAKYMLGAQQLISNPLLSEEKTQERLDICKSCDELDPNLMRCKKCGCFLAVKAKISITKCPLNKW